MRWFKQDPMDTVESAMKGQGMKYHRVDARTILSGFGLESRRYFVSIRHEEDKKVVLFLFHPTLPKTDVLQGLATGQPPFVRIHTAAGHTRDQVAEICELLMEENYRMVAGRYERDRSDGELRLCIAVPYRGAALTEEQVSWCIQVGLASIDTGMDKIDALLSSEKPGARMEV